MKQLLLATTFLIASLLTGAEEKKVKETGEKVLLHGNASYHTEMRFIIRKVGKSNIFRWKYSRSV